MVNTETKIKRIIETLIYFATVKRKKEEKGICNKAIRGSVLGKFPCYELSKDEVLSGFVLTIDNTNFTHQYNHRKQFVCVTFAQPFSGIMSSCCNNLYYNFCYHC